MSEFIIERRVAFGDCDPARIAYTGRIADFALDAIDAFWDDLLEGKGWFHMNVEQGFGMPFVRMEYDFVAPIAAGALLACHVQPESIGRSSVVLGVEGRIAGAPCFRARFVSVFALLEGIRKIDIPDPVRRALIGRFPALAS